MRKDKHMSALLRLAASLPLLGLLLVAQPAQAMNITYTHTDLQGSVVALSDHKCET